MRFALFYHSVVSDWNHGNAHFLRGLMRALNRRGHDTVCYEPRDAWSLQHLLEESPSAIADFDRRFPDLAYERYDSGPGFESWLRARLAKTDVAIVHEWNDPAVVRLVARVCGELGVRSLFHDTHYRVVLDAAHRRQLDLPAFDAILAYSPSVADRHREFGHPRVHVLHEAADTTVFGPRDVPKRDDVVFVGNLGEEDRRDGVSSWLFGPRRQLPELRYAIYGVRYPEALLASMRNGLNIDYRGRLPNADVPEAYSAAKVVLHIPRGPYVEQLPGTPTIRVFEALVSGACLVSSPWQDTDHLFNAGRDYVLASSPDEMRDKIAWLVKDAGARAEFGKRGREAILARHTCDHRAAELLEILQCAS
ncbi:MAG TPA: glycosyltransferase [Chloroflexota bacterium]|jgi:spore maturation protein CgeB|nr:glycosyltransferase [Chloroflexota bacterium]